MCDSERNSCFCYLPNEMKMAIFNRLHLNAKKTARRVCRCWNALISRSLVLEPELSDKTISTITGSSLPAVLLTVTDLKSTKSIPTSSRTRNTWLDSVRQVIFDEDASAGASEANLKKVLTHCCTKLQLLEFGTGSLKNVGGFAAVWTRMKFGRLTHLRIRLTTYERNHHHAIDKLLETQSFPRLFELNISFADIRRQTYYHPVKPYAKLLTTIYEFIARHRSTLKNLWLFEAEELAESEVPVFIRLPEETRNSLKKLNLDRLRLFLGNFDPKHPTWPAMCLAHNHKQLITLDVWGAPVPRDFLPSIQNNVKTLKYLYWTSDYVSPDNGLNQFDVSLIAGATQLVHFDLSANEVLNFGMMPKQLQRLVWSSDMTVDQLIWVSKNLNHLRILIIEENRDNETGVPYLTLLLLKTVLHLPKLQLFKLYGNYDEVAISEFCRSTPGLNFANRPDSPEEDEMSRIKARDGFRLTIDRSRLHPIHLA